MIDRRTFLRSTAGAAVLGGTCMTQVPSAAAVPVPVNAALARLIEAHRAAYDAVAPHCEVVSEAEAVFYQDKSNEMAQRAKENAHDTLTDILKAEKAAFLALLSHPVSTLEELRVIVAIGRKTTWENDAPDEEEAEALLAGIMAGGM